MLRQVFFGENGVFMELILNSNPFPKKPQACYIPLDSKF